MPNSLATIQLRTILNGLERGNHLAYGDDGHFYVFGMGTKPAAIYETNSEEIRRRVKEFVNRNKALLQPELLNELQERLAGRLKVLNRNTTGFYALLYFLFSFDRRQFWDNKQLDDRTYLTEFKTFLETAVRELRQPRLPVIPSASIIPPQPPTRPIPPRQPQAIGHPIPTPNLIPETPIPTPPKDQTPPLSDPIETNPQPTISPSPLTPPSPSNPPPPPPPPPSPTTPQSSLSSGLPPPPPPGFRPSPPIPMPPTLPGFSAVTPDQSVLPKTTRLPSLSPKTLFFKDEPIAPAYLSEKFSHLTKEEIEEQVRSIDEYYTSLEKMLIPIKETVGRYAKLVKERDEENKPHIAALEKVLEEQKKHLELLNQASSTGSFISFYHPQSELPFIPDDMFDEIQKRIAELQADPGTRNFKTLRLSTNFKISKAIECVQNYMAELTANIERYERKNAELQTQIELIEGSSNNGIPFAQFKTVLNSKDQLIRKAKTQISDRNKHVKGKPAFTLPVAPVITTAHPIFKEYPRLKPLENLPQPLEIAMQSKNPIAIYTSIRATED